MLLLAADPELLELERLDIYLLALRVVQLDLAVEPVLNDLELRRVLAVGELDFVLVLLAERCELGLELRRLSVSVQQLVFVVRLEFLHAQLILFYLER